jgi:hypothetical protein
MLSTHPDVTRSLAAERIASLLAEAEDHRRAHRPPARWRPARFRQPRADLQRVTPPTAAGQAERAA